MSFTDLSAFAADAPDAYRALAVDLAQTMRWTGAGSRSVPFPKGLVVQQWRAVTHKGNGKPKVRLCTLLVQGEDSELRNGNTAWPMLTHGDTARVLEGLARRSYGLTFTRSESGVWVVQDVPTVPGAGLVFACDPHLGVVAAHALIESARADTVYRERLQIRLSMGLPA